MEEQTTTTAAPKNKLMLYATIAIVLLLAIGAGYLFMTGALVNDGAGQADDGGPVAIVNGEEIGRRAYDNATTQFASIAAAQGVTLSEAEIQTQVLNSLINNRLLVQEAHKNGASATDAEVQAEYELIVENSGGADAFNTQIESLGITEAQVRSELAEQLAVNKFLMAKVTAANATTTEEEVTAFYADLTAANAEVPALEEIRAQIEEQILVQKQQQEVTQLVEALRASATVEILI